MIGLGWLRRLWRGERRIVTAPRWDRAVAPGLIDSIMSIPVTDRFHAKQGRSTGRLIVPTQNGERLVVYLKRHYRQSWRHRLLALLWPSRGWSPAAQEWKHLHWCQEHDIPVPEPLAMGEFIGPGFQMQSFLAIAELTAMLPLHEAIPLAEERMSAEKFEQWKRGVIVEAARLTRLLHEAKRYHKDLYLCHFYLPSTVFSPDSSLHLIDLHRLGHHPWLGWRWRVKDLAQLLYSSYIAGVTERDRLRFLHEYLGCRKLDAVGRRLLRAVRAKAGAYHRHNAKWMTTHEYRAVPRKSAA
jgi:hypothetical protein